MVANLSKEWESATPIPLDLESEWESATPIPIDEAAPQVESVKAVEQPVQKGIGTQALEEAVIRGEALPPNIVKAVPVGLAEGLTTELPRMVGGAMEFLGSQEKRLIGKAPVVGKWLEDTGIIEFTPQAAAERYGKQLKDWAETKGKEWYGDPTKRKGVERMVYEGTKMFGPSVIPAVAFSKTFQALNGLGNLVKAAKAAEGTAAAARLWQEANAVAKLATNAASGTVAGVFGLSQSQETADSAIKQAERKEKEGKIEEAKVLREKAVGIAPWITGGIEATGEYLGTKYLSKLFRLDEAEVVKKGLKNVVIDFLKSIGVEVGTEVGQTGTEAAVEKGMGIRPDADPLVEALDVIGPTVVMTLLTGGLAQGVNRIKTREAERDETEKKTALSMIRRNLLRGTDEDGDPFTINDVINYRDNSQEIKELGLEGELDKIVKDYEANIPVKPSTPPTGKPLLRREPVMGEAAPRPQTPEELGAQVGELPVQPEPVVPKLTPDQLARQQGRRVEPLEEEADEAAIPKDIRDALVEQGIPVDDFLSLEPDVQQQFIAEIRQEEVVRNEQMRKRQTEAPAPVVTEEQARSGGRLISEEPAQTPAGEAFTPSREVEAAPTPDMRPTAFQRLRGMLTGKAGRVREEVEEAPAPLDLKAKQPVPGLPDVRYDGPDDFGSHSFTVIDGPVAGKSFTANADMTDITAEYEQKVKEGPVKGVGEKADETWEMMAKKFKEGIYNKDFKKWDDTSDELPFDLSRLNRDDIALLERVYEISKAMPDEAMAFADFLANQVSKEEVDAHYKRVAETLKAKFPDVTREEIELARVLASETDYRTKHFEAALQKRSDSFKKPAPQAEGREGEKAKNIPIIDQETYLEQHGASRQDIGESALHKNIPYGKPRAQLLKRQSEKDAALVEKRDKLRKEYNQKVESGEIRPPTRMEKLIATANGVEDNESVQAARRILEKQGIDWKSSKPVFPTPKEGSVPQAKSQTGAKPPSESLEIEDQLSVARDTLSSVTEQDIRKAFGAASVKAVTLKFQDDTSEGFIVALPNQTKIFIDPTRDKIMFDMAGAARSYGMTVQKFKEYLEDTGGRATGKYRRVAQGGLIELLTTSDPSTLSHEKFHALFDLALNGQERQDILKRYGSEEKAANAFRRQEGFTRSFWEKMRSWLDKVRNALFGDVFKPVREATVSREKVGVPKSPSSQSLALTGEKATPSLLSTIRSLQRPGQNRELVSITRLREKMGEGGALKGYHGTEFEFDEFAKGDLGYHFGSDEMQAHNRLANRSWEKRSELVGKARQPRIIEAELDLKNPLRLDDITNWDFPTFINDNLLERGIITKKEYDILESSTKSTHARLKETRKVIQDKGYDGIVYKNEHEKPNADSYIVFNKEQITLPLDSQLLQLAREGKIALHRGDRDKGTRGLEVDGEYYVGVVPTARGNEELDRGGQALEIKSHGTLQYLRTEDGERLFRAVSGPFKGGVFTEEMAREEGFDIPGEIEVIAGGTEFRGKANEILLKEHQDLIEQQFRAMEEKDFGPKAKKLLAQDAIKTGKTIRGTIGKGQNLGRSIQGTGREGAVFDLKPGDFVSFRAPDGHIVKGKVRDIDQAARQVWVFHRETDLYDSPEAASTKVPFDQVVGQEDQALEIAEPDTIRPGDVNTREFKRWFGKSKVVDEAGKPLVVYHGTPFTLEGNAFREGTGNFTSTKSMAEGFGKVGSYYLSMQNPLEVKDPGFWTGDEFFNQLVDLGVLTRQEADSAFKQIHKHVGPYRERFQIMANAVKAKGYDGFVYENAFEGGGRAWKPFSPTQIKSVFNQGTWSPTEPDISLEILPPKDSVFKQATDNLMKDPKPRFKPFAERMRLARMVERNPLNEKAIELAYSQNTAKAFMDQYKGEGGKFKAEKFMRETGLTLTGRDFEDLNKYFHKFQTTTDIAEKFQAAKDLLSVQQYRQGRTNQMLSEMRKMTDLYFNLSGGTKSMDRVDLAFAHGDKIGRYLSVEQLKDDFHLNDEEIKSYFAVRKTMDYVLDLILKQKMNTSFGYERFEGGKDKDGKELKTVDAESIIKAIKARNSMLSRGIKGMEAKEVKKHATDILRRKLNELGLEKEEVSFIANSEGLADWAFKRRAYMPHTWQTEWRARVTTQDGKDYLFEVPTILGRIELTEEQRFKAATREALKVVHDRLGTERAKGASVTVVKHTQLPSDLFEGTGLANAQNVVESAVSQMMKDFDSGGLTEKQKEEIKAIQESITKHLKELYLAKGWGQHLLARKGVEGYRTTFRDVIPEYLYGFSAYYQKGVAIREFSQAFKQIDANKTPVLWDWSKNFIEDMLETTPEATSFKRVVGFWFLAADISAATLNMTQNWTHGIAMLRGIKVKGGPIAEAELAKAMKDVAMVWANARGMKLPEKGNKHVTDEELEALRETYQKGLLDPQFFGETTGLSTHKWYLNHLETAEKWAYTAFIGAEAMNRMSTFLAALRRAKRAGVDSPTGVAAKAVTDSHFLYGKVNRPAVVRNQRGVVGLGVNAAYTFMTYPVANILFLKQRALNILKGKTHEERTRAMKVLGSNLAYVVAFGGLSAFPFMFAFRWIYDLFTDPEDDWEKLAHKYASQNVARGAMRGIPAVFGNDMSWKVEGTSIGLTPIGIQTARQMARKFWYHGMKPILRGEAWHTIFMAGPDFVSNPYKALVAKGGSGIEGRPVVEYKGAEEKAWKAMGFSPTRESETRQIQQLAMRKRDKRLETIGGLAEKLAVARKLGDYNDIMKVWDELNRYNTKEREKGKEGLTITREDIIRSEKRKRESREKGYSERLPEYMRGFQKELGETFHMGQ